MPIVSVQSFDNIISNLSTQNKICVDTETTGLLPFHGSKAFSVGICTEEEDFYFNWNWYKNTPEEHILEESEARKFGEFLAQFRGLVYMHNAKFDMHMLNNLTCGSFLNAQIHCTQAIGRIVNNNLLSYSLDKLAQKYLGAKKDTRVEEYIKKHDLYGYDSAGGTEKKTPQYHRVPLDIMEEYCIKDARLTYLLGESQRIAIKAWDTKNKTKKKMVNVYKNECRLTMTLWKMEQAGIKLDSDYAYKASIEAHQGLKKHMKEFKKLTGEDFVDSKALAPIFDKQGIPYAKTEKGNPSFTDEVLSEINHPVVTAIRGARKAKKIKSSYFRNFLNLESKKTIHTDFQQSGTVTGRMSARNPALQTLPKPKEDQEGVANMVRRCFVPRPGFCFFMPDYDQMEYRFFLNYAKEWEVIKKVLGGLDVHTATAEVMGVDRTKAKTINFMLLYGGGTQKLADALKVTLNEATLLKEKYFQALPRVKELVGNIIFQAEQRGYLINYMGRKYIFEPEFSYKAPNYLIQGGTADVVKLALNECDRMLRGSNSRPLLQVHDELVFEVHKSELHLCREIVKIMENVYKADLPLTVSPEYSWKNLADKTEGYPNVKVA